jgi:hypothetical protein
MKAADGMSQVVPHGRGVRTYTALACYPLTIAPITTDSLCLFCSYPDGTVYDGEWVESLRCGRATVTHANGSIFNGSYDNDVACGEGSFTYPGGQIEVKGSWLQGQLHGEVCFSMPAR